MSIVRSRGVAGSQTRLSRRGYDSRRTASAYRYHGRPQGRENHRSLQVGEETLGDVHPVSRRGDEADAHTHPERVRPGMSTLL